MKPFSIKCAETSQRQRWSRLQTILADEMVDAVESDQAYHDEVDGDDEVQQPRHDQDQDAGDKGDDRRNVIGSENHFKSPRIDRVCNN